MQQLSSSVEKYAYNYRLEQAIAAQTKTTLTAMNAGVGECEQKPMNYQILSNLQGG